MALDDLLQTDSDAWAFFHGLSQPIQASLFHCGENINSLAALRDYTKDLDAKHIRADGSPLDPALRAEWTRAHQT